MLTAIGSAKGSPGATTVALALAAVWPDQAAILVEADASGGDLAFRCRHDGGAEVATTPSMTSLAAATRGHTDLGSAASSLLRGHTQRLACGVRVVPGLLGPSQAGAIEHLWGNVAGAANAAEEPVIADVGRITGSLAARAFLDRSAVAVVVCQPTLESLVHTRSLVASLATRVESPRSGTAGAARRGEPATACRGGSRRCGRSLRGDPRCRGRAFLSPSTPQLPSSWSGGRTRAAGWRARGCSGRRPPCGSESNPTEASSRQPIDPWRRADDQPDLTLRSTWLWCDVSIASWGSGCRPSSPVVATWEPVRWTRRPSSSTCAS